METSREGVVDLYMLAGVATWPGFFRGFADRLAALCTEAGVADARVRTLYPYGDHTRSPLAQIRDVRRDLSRRRALREAGAFVPRHAAGVAAAADDVRRASAGRAVVLIGHSGGGVAAYHIARQLLAEGAIADCRVVQIGSPKVPVAPDMRARVGFFYAADGSGRPRGPVARIGSWGGLRTSRFGVPAWDRFRYAPGCVRGISIAGGHADYFRPGAPYVLDGASNLQRTAGAVWEWLSPSIGNNANDRATL